MRKKNNKTNDRYNTCEQRDCKFSTAGDLYYKNMWLCKYDVYWLLSNIKSSNITKIGRGQS